MDHDATVVGPHDNVARAASIMRDWKVGVLPVCDGRRLIGTVSDSDIRLGTARENRAEEEIRVAELMSEDVVWCFEDETLSAVMHRFGDSQQERIPVLDREKNLVGMLNLDRGTNDPRVADEGGRNEPMRRWMSPHINNSF
jgi:CBS domain-containing protein